MTGQRDEPTLGSAPADEDGDSKRPPRAWQWLPLELRYVVFSVVSAGQTGGFVSWFYHFGGGVTVDELLNFLEPQFPHLSNGKHHHSHLSGF